MKTKPFALIAAAALLLSTFHAPLSVCHAQGALIPPAAPAPLMKSLDQIEPRTPISGQVILYDSGSYYLTTNVLGNGGYGIIIQADNISVDLCGFELAGGPNPTTGGIVVSGPHTNLTVYNGIIRNWGGIAVDASTGTGNRFESLKIFNNKGAGLLSGTLSQVRSSSVSFNNGDGMVLGANSAVIDSMAIANNGRGIVVADSCSIKNSSVNANTNGGIFAGLNCLLNQCVVVSNFNLGGLVVSSSSSVVECVVNNNSGTGITTDSYCTVRDCDVVHNAGAGILVRDNCSIKNSTVNANPNGGIFAGLNSLVSQCIAVSNINVGNSSLGSGITVSNNSSVLECLVSYNSSNGIVLAPNCTARECNVFRNPGNGIIVSDNCRVVGNNCAYNGVPVPSGNVAAIDIGGLGSRIEGNNVFSNANRGISILAFSETSNNVIVKNISMWNLGDYSIATMDIMGPQIYNGEAGVGLDGNIITNSNPWANFSTTRF